MVELVLESASSVVERKSVNWILDSRFVALVSLQFTLLHI